jgi:uncharacterized cupin superfamily protein
MRTELGRLSDTPASRGLPAAVRDPIKPHWFTGRGEAQLGKAVGLTQFGVNHITLEPGAVTSLRHWHESEDEFVFVLSGNLVLIDENGEHGLGEGGYAGFPAGRANAHHLVNRSNAPARLLVVGTRKVGLETIHYPDDFAEPRTMRRGPAGDRIPD